MPGACPNGRCINAMGSYRCLCNNGFRVDSSGSQCIDINECDLDPKPCDFDCRNTHGSFICSCPSGYIIDSDGRKCQDVDECKTGKHNCPQSCVNTRGSFECSCQPGFRQHAATCIGRFDFSKLRLIYFAHSLCSLYLITFNIKFQLFDYDSCGLAEFPCYFVCDFTD